MTNNSFDTFRVANEYLADFNRLNDIYEMDGYLFFRGVLDIEDVLRVKRDFVRIFQGQGVVKSGASDPLYTGANIEHIDDTVLYSLDSYINLIQSQQMRRLLEGVFGEPAFISPGINIRYALPSDEARVTPAHQDHFFIREHDNFGTLWVPLMELEANMGPLAIASGTHKHGLVDHVEQEDRYSYIFKGRKQVGIPVEEVQAPWLTIDFRPGDVLLFNSLLIHRALVNTSDRVRLSLDTRCQPKSAPRLWQLERSIPESRQYRKDVQQVATEEGVTEEQFEVLVVEMMKRGLPVERNQIKAVLTDLAQPENQ